MRNVTCLWTCLQEFMSLLLCILAICQICCTTSDDDEYPNDLLEGSYDEDSNDRNISHNKSPAHDRGSILIANFSRLANLSRENVSKYIMNFVDVIDQQKEMFSEQIVGITRIELRNKTVHDLLKSITGQVKKFLSMTVDEVSVMLTYIEHSVIQCIIKSVERVKNYAKTCGERIKEEIRSYGNASADALAKACAKNIKKLSRSSVEDISTFSKSTDKLVTGLLKESGDILKKLTARNEEYLKKSAKISNLKSVMNLANASADDLKSFANTALDHFKNLSIVVTDQIYSFNNRTAEVLPILAEDTAYSVTNLTQPRPGGGNLTAGKYNSSIVEGFIGLLYKSNQLLPRETFHEMLRSILSTRV